MTGRCGHQMPWPSPAFGEAPALTRGARGLTRLAVALMLTAGPIRVVHAQAPAFSDPQASGPAPAAQAATLTYANRPVVELRAQVLTRMPAERAAAAVGFEGDAEGSGCQPSCGKRSGAQASSQRWPSGSAM